VRLVDDLLASVARFDSPVKRVCLGLHWTIVESRGVGVAHTIRQTGVPEPEGAGSLVGRSAVELSRRLSSSDLLEASLGLAALNSLVEPVGDPGNVVERIRRLVPGKTVTVVGRFPFNDEIGRLAKRAYFLEMAPAEGELPAAACEDVIPLSDVAIITATALINKTLPRLLELARGRAAIVLGPSTPLNDVLFAHGASVIGGVKVHDAEALAVSVMQGVKKFGRLAGIQPVTRQTVA
jgi:uncharacterized protein (DUF4213/DUF364 family)